MFNICAHCAHRWLTAISDYDMDYFSLFSFNSDSRRKIFHLKYRFLLMKFSNLLRFCMNETKKKETAAKRSGKMQQIKVRGTPKQNLLLFIVHEFIRLTLLTTNSLRVPNTLKYEIFEFQMIESIWIFCRNDMQFYSVLGNEESEMVGKANIQMIIYLIVSVVVHIFVYLFIEMIRISCWILDVIDICIMYEYTSQHICSFCAWTLTLAINYGKNDKRKKKKRRAQQHRGSRACMHFVFVSFVRFLSNEKIKMILTTLRSRLCAVNSLIFFSLLLLLLLSTACPSNKRLNIQRYAMGYNAFELRCPQMNAKHF